MKNFKSGAVWPPYKMKKEESKESSLHRYIVESLKIEGWREQAAKLKSKAQKPVGGTAKLSFKFQTSNSGESMIDGK
jgi:hypothetical protein